ncbi:MAG: 1,4-dihydroxy-2-naphthoate octaprenyltransferase [Bacteroidales bacterium]|nr:1,4-dihydroxy-2-naphthoate octaprenyltransferase [Bacteroidales bacterium]
MKQVLLWFKVIRPYSLFASFCPVAVGLLAEGVRSTLVAVATMACALSLQIFSNLVNDYFDFKRGADKVDRDGPERMMAQGAVSEAQMRKAIIVTLIICLLLGIYLVYCGGWPILLIGVASVAFAWLYTATNHSLSYLGIADIFVFIFYGVVASTGTTFLQTESFSFPSFYAGAVCGLISMCLLIINNLRDIESDKEVGKRTFPVRFGKRAGEIGMLGVVLLMPLFAWLAFGFSWPMLIVVPALLLFAATLRAKGKQYNPCMMGAGITNLIYVGLCLLA